MAAGFSWGLEDESTVEITEDGVGVVAVDEGVSLVENRSMTLSGVLRLSYV